MRIQNTHCCELKQITDIGFIFKTTLCNNTNKTKANEKFDRCCH